MPAARAAVDVRTEYLPEFGRPVRIREFNRPNLSDDEETAQTVSYMDEISAHDANDPAVISAAYDALDLAAIDDRAPAYEKACAVFWWLKKTIEYVPTPGTSRLVDQTLISPTAVLAMPAPIGDCPQFSMLASAMFRVLCMDSMFVTIKADERLPDQWSHIYNTVEVFPGQYLPFDSSNGPEPGAEYSRPFGRRVWPRIAPGRCSERSKETMLRQTYAGRPAPSVRNVQLRRALGDVTCDQDGNCYDSSSGVYTPAPVGPVTLQDIQGSATQGDCAYGADAAGNCLPGDTVPSHLPGAPSSGPGIAATIGQDIANILTPITRALSPASPYYVTSPTGQKLVFNPATNTYAPAPAATASLSGSAPLLLIGGLVIAAIAFGRK